MSLDFDLTMQLDTGNEPYECTLYGANYTHNVGPMWRKAGVYEALYMSEGKQAKEFVDDLVVGYQFMRDNPDEFIPLNPRNGWGDYPSALFFLNGIVDVCVSYPNAVIRISK